MNTADGSGDDDQTEADEKLAGRLFAEWDGGKGTSKSRIEVREWNDATSHGRRFDRFIRRTLGRATNRPSRQTDRIGDMEGQLRRLGVTPAGGELQPWEGQLQHARSACLAALRVWNDPMATFRTGTFALLFVAAWNSLAIAILQQRGEEWRELDDFGSPRIINGAEQARLTMELVVEAFGAEPSGLRENVHDWVELRNCVAHRHLPALDAAVIPLAQAGLLNFEDALVHEFGHDWALADQLSVPLQLSGFRDPGVLSSLKRLQASLPVDVQAILARASEASPELLADPTYMLRVAFIPAVPASGHSPDAVAYFVKPGEVADELSEAMQKYVIVPKVARPLRPNLGAKDVVKAVQERIPWRFTLNQHVALTRSLGARPERGAKDVSDTDQRYCEYVPAAKLHLYNQAWVDYLVDLLAAEEGYETYIGRPPVPKER